MTTFVTQNFITEALQEDKFKAFLEAKKDGALLGTPMRSDNCPLHHYLYETYDVVVEFQFQWAHVKNDGCFSIPEWTVTFQLEASEKARENLRGTITKEECLALLN